MTIEIKKEQEFTTNRDYLGITTAQTAQYLVHGAATEAEAFAKLKETAVTYIGDLKIKNYELNEVKGGGAWTYDVNYEKSLAGNPDNPTVQQPQYAYNTGSASVKIIAHLGEVWKSEGAESIPGIGWDGEKFEGVDIAVANPTESYTIFVPKSKFTTKVRRRLAEMAWHVNEKKFKGWEPGEVLFVGANVSRSGDENYSMTFSFAISLNEEDVDFIGITIPEKKGFHYAWAIKSKSGLKGKEILPEAKHVYVHKTYKTVDFKDLGIGT